MIRTIKGVIIGIAFGMVAMVLSFLTGTSSTGFSISMGIIFGGYVAFVCGLVGAAVDLMSWWSSPRL